MRVKLVLILVSVIGIGQIACAQKYSDGRPEASLRIDARDYGIVLRHGDGPDSCDILGARDVWVFEDNGKYYMHYDAAGPDGWLSSLAVSTDLINWEKKGPILDFGKPGDKDYKAACYGVTYLDDAQWHMFYLGTPNVLPAPDLIPSFPYLTMKAKGNGPLGPWIKQNKVIPFRIKDDTYYSLTASPGHVIKNGNEYLQFFSSTTRKDGNPSVQRTLGIARTKNMDDSWTVDPNPLVPIEEQIENSSLYFEESNNTWFLFTNHIGIEDGKEFTDAIWVYWSKDLNSWDPDNKAIVLDGENCSWSNNCIGLPSVVEVGNKLALFYDAPGGESISHMKRNIGLAWIDLPLLIPQETEAKKWTYKEENISNEIKRIYILPESIRNISESRKVTVKNTEALLVNSSGQADLAGANLCTLNGNGVANPSILIDFGKELHGGLEIVTGGFDKAHQLKIRLTLGESVSEAMSKVESSSATNDHAMRDFELSIPWLGKISVGNSGFRFARIELLNKDVELTLKEVLAVSIMRDIPYLGSFECNDDRLNKIWKTGAYTVHLNMQEFLWDGIKRDRLVWVGDMHPEVMTILSVFGYNEVVPKSLDFIQDITKLPSWMNGISSYSMWWVIIQHQWYMNTGDISYLRFHKKNIYDILELLSNKIDKNGKEFLDGHRFLDWPTSPNKEAIHAGLQSLMLMSFNAGAEIAALFKDIGKQEEYLAISERLKKHLPSPNGNKSGGALMAISGLSDPRAINDSLLSVDPNKGVSTFYGYYVLKARAEAGDITGALNVIRDYWGGMLDMGATSFWEDFDLSWTENATGIDEMPVEGKSDIHADNGDYCYVGLRNSLSHGWASGPTAWLSEYVLGVKPLEPGCKKVLVNPNLGDLEWVKGSYPTPFGVIKVHHSRDENGEITSDIEAPPGVEIVHQDVFLGQGLLSGEITSSTVILQSRLTVSNSLSEGDLAGKHGFGMFQLSLDSTFKNPICTKWLEAVPENDFILKSEISGLQPGMKYYYRLMFCNDTAGNHFTSKTASLKTHPGADSDSKVSFVVVTGMNYYFFHYGNYNINKAYSGKDKGLGYPALEAIIDIKPDYFIGTGDNVYFDHPNKGNFEWAVSKGQNPHPAGFDGKEVVDETGMRKKYHEQFSQTRFQELFRTVGTYWEKDDHDYRFNDADPYQEFPISHELGIKNFREQLPVVNPEDMSAKTYRTHVMSKDLQIWLLEGRDYRSPNIMKDGPDKTLLGAEQLMWLKETLLASNASFKLIISPTPLVGPDDAYKKDNHVNHLGFRNEGDAIFDWLVDNGFLNKNLYIICGDRHWQYHSMHPSGIEEFSTGALVDNNSRGGRLAGDPKSTDPDGLVKQYYIQGDRKSASGGFLSVTVKRDNNIPGAIFRHYDEKGKLLYENVKRLK